MHGLNINAIAKDIGKNISNAVSLGEAKSRETLESVFKIPTFYYHHGKKLR